MAASASMAEGCIDVVDISVSDAPTGSSAGCDDATITAISSLVVTSDSLASEAVPTPAEGSSNHEGCSHANLEEKLEEEAVVTAPALSLPPVVSFQFPVNTFVFFNYLIYLGIPVLPIHRVVAFLSLTVSSLV